MRRRTCSAREAGSSWSQLARRVSRDPGDVDVILPFDEVVAALGRVEERYVGLRAIELDTVLGTVGRERGGFDRQFRPTTARVRARWERIANAARRGEPLPPISVYRIGDVHFVRDGHHRVSVARALGRDTIEAYVVEVVTRVGAERSLRVGDLPLKSHERLFHERVPLPARAPAQERIRLGDPVRTPPRTAAARPCEADMRIVAHRYVIMRTHEWNEDILARVRESDLDRKR